MVLALQVLTIQWRAQMALLPGTHKEGRGHHGSELQIASHRVLGSNPNNAIY